MCGWRDPTEWVIVASMMRWLAAIALTACGTAAADKAGADAQCKAIFASFGTLPPNVDAPSASKAIGDRAWLAASDDQPVDELGGKVPVEMNTNDQVFVIRCLKQNTWAIYGRLSGRKAETFGAFLDGDASQKLVEYALVYPDGKIVGHRSRKNAHEVCELPTAELDSS